MSNSNYTQSSFLGGEWSPFAQGRADKPEYRQAMNVCRNSYPLEEGTWIRRSGSRFVAWTRNGQATKIIPFAFESALPYLLEFTNGYLRFLTVSIQSQGLSVPLPQDFRLAGTNDNQAVLTITSLGVVQTGAAHGWSTGNQVMFLFAKTVGALVSWQLWNRQFSISVIDSTHFSIVDAASGFAVNPALIPSLTGLNGDIVVMRILELSGLPYTTADLPNIRIVQAETTAILLNGNYAPNILSVLTLPSAGIYATFNITHFSSLIFLDGPYLDPPIDGSTLTPSGTNGVTITASAATSINGGAGFKSSDVGRLLRAFSQPAPYASGTTYSIGNSVSYAGTFFTCIQSATGKQPDISTAYWVINLNAAAWTWGIISVVSSSTVVTVNWTSGGGYLLYTAQVILVWRLGLYSQTSGWPTCGLYYQGRIFLAGAQPNRLDASAPNQIPGNGILQPTPVISFSPTAPDGTVSDANGISYTFNSTDVNPIYWLKEVATGILAGTLSGEWLIPSTPNNPLTPSNFSANRVTNYGCENIEPTSTELTSAFVQRFGRKLLESFQDVFSGRSVAQNLAEFAKHLTTSGIAEIRYQQELLPIIWSRMNNGSLAGATYKRDSLFSNQPCKFIGWHRHDLGSGYPISSMAICPTQDGRVDTLAMITNNKGVYQIEMMSNIFDVDEQIQNGWFLDNATVPAGGIITTTAQAFSGIINFVNQIGQRIQFVNNSNQALNFYTQNLTYWMTLYGLWHLNNQTVSISIAGIDCGDALVTNGEVTCELGGTANLASIQYLGSISSTTAYGANGTQIVYGINAYTVPVVIGSTYISQGQILRPDTQDQTRSPVGPGQAKSRRSHQFGALLQNTQGISFGTNFSKMHLANFKTLGLNPIPLNELYSGVFWDTLDDTNSFDGMLAWQVVRPYPSAVVAVTPFMNTQDR
jgi:hypothetical protein